MQCVHAANSWNYFNKIFKNCYSWKFWPSKIQHYMVLLYQLLKIRGMCTVCMNTKESVQTGCIVSCNDYKVHVSTPDAMCTACIMCMGSIITCMQIKLCALLLIICHCYSSYTVSDRQSFRAKRLIAVRELFTKVYRSSVPDIPEQQGGISKSLSELLSKLTGSGTNIVWCNVYHDRFMHTTYVGICIYTILNSSHISML